MRITLFVVWVYKPGRVPLAKFWDGLSTPTG